MKGPRPGWDKDMHFVRSADFFRSAHSKLVSCGNQFELIGAQARAPPRAARAGARCRCRALAEQRWLSLPFRRIQLHCTRPQLLVIVLCARLSHRPQVDGLFVPSCTPRGGRRVLLVMRRRPAAPAPGARCM